MLRKVLLTSLVVITSAACSPFAIASLSGDDLCRVGKELNLPVTEWKDLSQPEIKGVVIAIHGLTLYAGAFEPMAKHLASEGFHVYAMDMRGFGRWRKQGKEFGGDSKIHVSQSQVDLLALVKRVRADNPGKKLYFLGESQGSNLALTMIENHPELSDGAILASPCYHTRVHPTLRWIPDGASELIKFNHPLNLEPYTRPYLTNDPVLTEKCDNDPLVNRMMTPEELVKSLIENRRAIKSAGKIPIGYPVLMMAGEKDAVFKSKQLPREIKKFGNYQDITFTMLPNKGHLLIEHQPVNPEIGRLIDTWLEQQISLSLKARKVDAARDEAAIPKISE